MKKIHLVEKTKKSWCKKNLLSCPIFYSTNLFSYRSYPPFHLAYYTHLGAGACDVINTDEITHNKCYQVSAHRNGGLVGIQEERCLLIGSILGLCWHVEECDMILIMDYLQWELGFHGWFIKAWESLSSRGRLKLCGSHRSGMISTSHFT